MKQRYILGGSPALVRALVEVLTADSEVDLIATGGPADAPTRLVVDAPREWADLMRAAFRGHLVVEPDAPLDLC
ncbi:hypothetical protein QLQ12_09935 [Actinoplanes sp. NEAU-A12]|uniref:Uncharacterized protein n=1 Tax=Actinoplanes sandaracinus TaxID=3045177 RepID=A0ABT6WGR8_9ACTN|nr:hypothetical protein [Actinoplanes sandaracinus]MDI6098919.1 hypothetical protein [Actinoplanes sandaracinus]